VNGVSKRRYRIRWNKLWEYSRGLAYVPWQKGWTAVDFGGGATLPVYYLASQGVTVHSYDIDTALTAEAQAAAAKHQWPVVATTQDLTSDTANTPSGVDWIMSFCVLEHLPRELQLKVAGILAGMLRPGGWFTVTFDYSPDAPVHDALRSPQDVQDLIDATGLVPHDGVAFSDTGERFVLDRKYPDSAFTFGSLFLRKPPL
jgi:cyclopropane fatty-acyl-phospholipid synthase-like methyltransferase